MRPYVDMWVIPEDDNSKPDEKAILEAIRAVPQIVLADRFFGSDLIAVIDSTDLDAFQQAVAALESIDPAVSVSNIRLARA